MSDYTETATIIDLDRNEFIWNPTFQAKMDTKGKWTGSESFTCRMKDVTRVLPTVGSYCQMEGFSFMTLSEFAIQNIEGDLCEVTCSYSGYSENQFTFDTDTPSNLDNYVYDLQIQQEESDIGAFYKFLVDDPIPKAEWITIRSYRSGLYSILDAANYTFYATGDKTKAQVAAVNTTLGRKLLDYLAVGVESFIWPRQVWRVSYTTKDRPAAAKLNDVGKITTPPGAPALAAGRSWLFTGINVQENDKIFTISEEYLLSDIGGWDTFLYGDDVA